MKAYSVRMRAEEKKLKTVYNGPDNGTQLLPVSQPARKTHNRLHFMRAST